VLVVLFVFFFSSRRRHTRFDCDWSSDVCSSDLSVAGADIKEEPVPHTGKDGFEYPLVLADLRVERRQTEHFPPGQQQIAAARSFTAEAVVLVLTADLDTDRYRGPRAQQQNGRRYQHAYQGAPHHVGRS